MKLKFFVISGVMVVVMVLSGCAQSSQTQKASEVNPGIEKSEVVLVPARKGDQSSKREIVVEEDGTFYEMLKEHERLCHDCDR